MGKYSNKKAVVERKEIHAHKMVYEPSVGMAHLLDRPISKVQKQKAAKVKPLSSLIKQKKIRLKPLQDPLDEMPELSLEASAFSLDQFPLTSDSKNQDFLFPMKPSLLFSDQWRLNSVKSSVETSQPIIPAVDEKETPPNARTKEDHELIGVFSRLMPY